MLRLYICPSWSVIWTYEEMITKFWFGLQKCIHLIEICPENFALYGRDKIKIISMIACEAD